MSTLTIGKKIGIAVGVVLILLAAVATWSVSGISGLVDDVDVLAKNADEVSKGNALRAALLQHELDQLNWSGQVNKLLTDASVTELKTELDPKAATFGKWLYGDEAKNAKALVPQLSESLDKIEKPYKEMYASAREIKEEFRQSHPGLLLTLSGRLIDHVKWVNTASQSLAAELGGMQRYQNTVRNAVDQAISAIGSVDTSKTNGELAARQKLAMELIKKLRYGPDGKEYFWIQDANARIIMHPIKPELNGKDLSKSQDPKGKYIFSDFATTAEAPDGGFVMYYWPKPGREEPVPKISFVKKYPAWGWIVGTGVYLNEENKQLMERAKLYAENVPFSLKIQSDPTKCAMGRWMQSAKTKELLATFPKLNRVIEEMHAPHNHLHESAVHIEKLVNKGNIDEALDILQLDVNKTLKEIEALFNEGINAEQELRTAAANANSIYAEKTLKNLHDMQNILHEMITTTQNNTMTDEKMLEAAETAKDGGEETQSAVTIVSLVALVIGILLSIKISNGIVTTLVQVISGLNAGAQQTASAASQISASSQSLAEGSTEQAASLEETSSALEEMASMTRQNADNSNAANEMMKHTEKMVGEGSEAVHDMATAMDAINQSSDEISKIIKTIEEIAFQTNLLALNAAVEAARAGDAGKGFAVVADEVRNLAQRSAQAARDTAELIEGTVTRVRNGNSIAEKLETDFKSLEDSASKVSGLVEEITAASNEQAQGVDQVNTAVAQMDKITQQNAATAEESASASEELSAQAAQMNELVQQLSGMVGLRESAASASHAQPMQRQPKALMHQPAEKAKRTTPPNTGLKVVSPQEIIPMDED